MPVFLQAAHHVGAHPAKTDHAELHSFAPIAKVKSLLAGLMTSHFISLCSYYYWKAAPRPPHSKN